MKHSVFGVILWDGVFSIDYLQFGSVLKRMLLKTQKVEDAPKSLHGRTDGQTGNPEFNLLSNKKWSKKKKK